MCVIAYKPMNENFCGKSVLSQCFDSNPDGAGFMYAVNGKVFIQKGYMTFNSFWKSLKKVRSMYGDKIPYVMHFRIGTQGGNVAQNTHPFPLSKNMQDLKQLKFKTDIGIAHNGIIDLTSSGWGSKVDYSDTMKFITDYASLIIKDKNYYKDEDTKLLLERLADSRLCILDKDGHCECLGDGWIYDKELKMYFSNSSYVKPIYKKKPTATQWSSMYDFDYDYTNRWYNTGSSASIPAAYEDEWEDFIFGNKYEFDETFCPMSCEGDCSYCSRCLNKNYCSLLCEVENEDLEQRYVG